MSKSTKALALVLAWLCFAAPLRGDDPRTLIIGLGNFDPYYREDGTGGIFVDLLEEIFNLLPQYEIEYVYNLSNHRLIAELNSGRLDGAVNILRQNDINGFISEPIFRFADVAVSLKSRNIKIFQPKDLKNHSLVTYQGANIFLNGILPKPEEFNGHYEEVPHADTLAKIVAFGRADFAVLDLVLFLNTIQDWSDGGYSPGDFDYHHLFPVIFSYMGFNDKAVRDDFNRALLQIKETGRFDAFYTNILRNYGYETKGTPIR